MITALQLKESQLDELYDWVDGLALSRPKKYIFSEIKKYQSRLFRWNLNGINHSSLLPQNCINA